MKKIKLKLIFLSIMFIAIIAMPILVSASNENIEILVKSNGDGIIYVKDHLDSAFEFAFSNDQNQDKSTLNFKHSETDSSVNGNNIAYINEEISNDYFNDPTKNVYFWVKSGNEYFVESVELDKNKFLSEDDIDYVNKITKRINVNFTTTSSTEKKDDVEITVEVGKTELKDEGTFLYQLIKPETEDYKNFIKLAERMSKLNSVDTYTELKTYREFANLYEKLLNEIDTNKWEKAENNEVLQPEDAQNGDQYILWLIDTSKREKTLDVQILTSVRKESQKVIKEKVTTNLPVTYDNNILLIILGILIIATTIVSIRIKTLKNKQEK